MTAPRAGQRSRALFGRALDLFPGGVDSPVRAFRSVGGDPFIVAAAEGARLTDVDGNAYVDWVMSWGPLILGHADPAVVEALEARIRRGTSYGAPCEEEVAMAEAVVARFPSIEKLRFTSSGTEAAMSAVRLARAATGRDRLIKCDGCYHGHVDALLVKAGSGLATQGLADSAGVPANVAAATTVVPFNDLEAVAAALRGAPGEYAAVLVEPVAANMGLVPPADGYLEGLARLCSDAGTLLVFDEVITGFRVAPGGAQERYGVTPDITILGKIIGGGLPVGAYGARRELMALVAPDGPVYQAGTLSGNPIAMTAGLVTLARLAPPGPYTALEATARALADDLRRMAREAGLSVIVHQLASLLTVFFAEGPIRNYTDAAGADRARFATFHRAMLERGVFLPPSQFEAWFLSTAHGQSDLEATRRAAAESFRVVAAG
ncbi:MAG TPA: glutamate-1-semialdehyde 2,1-aminomutase [Candidatus Eisenbacteria bacterium]